MIARISPAGEVARARRRALEQRQEAERRRGAARRARAATDQDEQPPEPVDDAGDGREQLDQEARAARRSHGGASSVRKSARPSASGTATASATSAGHQRAVDERQRAELLDGIPVGCLTKEQAEAPERGRGEREQRETMIARPPAGPLPREEPAAQSQSARSPAAAGGARRAGRGLRGDLGGLQLHRVLSWRRPARACRATVSAFSVASTFLHDRRGQRRVVERGGPASARRGSPTRGSSTMALPFAASGCSL